MWDLQSSVCLMELGPHENGVQVLGLSNGTIATTSTGESVNGKPANFKLRLWDASTGSYDDDVDDVDEEGEEEEEEDDDDDDCSGV